ncbi:radical SAM protein [Tenacibaculum tangerinum]|uniref:Radical SAM protein n=1 Tax=Tenacibaculum tangerinum TaxID=3038772 RepID=A0ABY8L4X3_9FLAO|nr:radical SAM protein [Tenacibaculum tangerinum]WGH74960.1 radical SAM protein [Tenacibaculum tangerinum]
MNFNSLVLKIASRCNLNCSYCFMYNLGDTTYKKQPKFMSPEVVDNLIEKTKEYIEKYNKKQFSFIFHGGEPLLASKDFFIEFVSKVKKNQHDLTNVSFSFDIQTNGVLLDKSWIKLFKELNISPSISVDGTKKAHDMYRVDHKGNGSYDSVFKSVKLLKSEMNFADIACVVNINESPEEIYKSFKEMNASYVNFLIPDYTHDNFPFDKNKTLMADWLIDLFEIWIRDSKRFKIPLFLGLLNSFMRINENAKNESTVLVIETNGEIEAIDSLKACGQGFTKTGLNIKDNSFQDIENTSLGKLYFNDLNTKLCKQCLECPLNEICKGGRLVHRHSKVNGFNNPSVYCNDLIKLIAHLQKFFISCYPELHEKENIEPINPIDIINYLSSFTDNSNSPYKKELEFFSEESLVATV